MCCSVLQYVAVDCSLLQFVLSLAQSQGQGVAVYCSVMQSDAECCSVTQVVALYCSLLQKQQIPHLECAQMGTHMLM